MFRIIFIQNLLYFLDEENSGLVTCSIWLQSNGLFPSRNNPNTGDRGGWGHRFSRDIKEVSGVIMKNPWNFHCSWFLTLKSPKTKGMTQFCRIHCGECLFSKSRVTYLKNPGFFFLKIIYRDQNKGKCFVRTSIY